jgi:phage-related tail protein
MVKTLIILGTPLLFNHFTGGLKADERINAKKNINTTICNLHKRKINSKIPPMRKTFLGVNSTL